MNIPKLSWANLLNKPLNTLLSILLLTLGVGLIVLLLLLNKQLNETFNKNIKGIDMVVGAKGSPLQLILSSIYQIDYPTGNIALQEAQVLQKHPLVKKSIPLAYGDSYQNYRIVGTTHQYPEHYEASIAVGELWQNDFEVSIGQGVAQQSGLSIGDTFYGTHGLNTEGEKDTHQHHAYRVVGIFKANGTVLDQLILCNINSVWRMHEEEHEHEHEYKHDTNGHEDNHEHEHENKPAKEEITEDREITALLIEYRSPMAMMQLPRYINDKTSMQAAVPAFEVNRLLGLMGVGFSSLRWVAILIMVISGISVFISLYSSLKARTYEMALLGSMGASKVQLFLLILLESLLLCFIGYCLGWLLGHVGMWQISRMLSETYTYPFSAWLLNMQEFWLLIITLAIGTLAALLPAASAATVDIAKHLKS